jgi:hypothetical protein
MPHLTLPSAQYRESFLAAAAEFAADTGLLGADRFR